MSELDFKYANIDKNSSTAEINAEISRLTDLATGFRNDDQASKVLLNSIYGVIGSDVFIGYSREVAQSVTLQSQDIILYMERCFNKYFVEMWHMDKELHKLIGLTSSPYKIHTPVVNYLDTDSVFVVLREAFEGAKTAGYTKDFIDFSLELQKHRIKGYVEMCLDAYTKKFNAYQTRHDGSPSFSLVMEQISHSVTWIKKKKYIKDTIWKKGARFESLSKIEIKGLEANTSSIPKYVRKRLFELIKFLLEADGKPDFSALISKLTEIRNDFEILPIDDICRTERISEYQKYIINDTTAVEIGPNCKPHTKGAALYNYLLYNDEKMKNKYQFIQSGERVKYLSIKDSSFNTDVFSFSQGAFPYEFKIQPDYDAQFEALVLRPFNNISKALSIEPLDSNLILFPIAF